MEVRNFDISEFGIKGEPLVVSALFHSHHRLPVVLFWSDLKEAYEITILSDSRLSTCSSKILISGAVHNPFPMPASLISTNKTWQKPRHASHYVPSAAETKVCSAQMSFHTQLR